MAKVAIKSESITSFGGIYHIMDVFSKLGFEKPTETIVGKHGCSGKAYSYGSIFASLFFSYLCGGECLEDISTLIGYFRQRSDSVLPGPDIVGCGLKNFYRYLIRHISEKVKLLKKTSRLKAFILHFISVPAKWVRTGRQSILNLYTHKAYRQKSHIQLYMEKKLSDYLIKSSHKNI